MAKDFTPIDISTNPELARLAEEVAASGRPRVLRRGSEDVAILMPIKPNAARGRSPRMRSKEDYEAFLASPGSWSDFDVEEFLKSNEESRQTNTRSPVEL